MKYLASIVLALITVNAMASDNDARLNKIQEYINNPSIQSLQAEEGYIGRQAKIVLALITNAEAACRGGGEAAISGKTIQVAPTPEGCSAMLGQAEKKIKEILPGLERINGTLTEVQNIVQNKNDLINLFKDKGGDAEQFSTDALAIANRIKTMCDDDPAMTIKKCEGILLVQQKLIDDYKKKIAAIEKKGEYPAAPEAYRKATPNASPATPRTRAKVLPGSLESNATVVSAPVPPKLKIVEQIRTRARSKTTDN